MTSARSFKHNWIKASWLVILGAVIGAALRVTWIKAQPKVYVSAAKLTVNPAMEASREIGQAEPKALSDAKQEARNQIESADLRERALQRFLAREKFAGKDSSGPNGTQKIETSDGSGPAIVMVRAFGSEPRSSRQFLDAVLDEFMYFIDSEAVKASALGGFRIAVLERASGAVEDNRELWFPAMVFGVAGGLCGFALSLCLADWLTKKQGRALSPDPEPPVFRRAVQESFFQTSSRFSGLVLIGMSLGISVQFLSMHEVDQRPFWSARLEARSHAGSDTEGSRRDEIRDSVNAAAKLLQSHEMATRALEKIKVMSRNKADTRSLSHSAFPDPGTATVEVRAYGEEQKGAQMLLEALLGEFENSQASSAVKMMAAGPPCWTEPKAAGKTVPIAMGGLVGGFAGFSLALLIAAIVRAANPSSHSPPPLPAPE